MNNERKQQEWINPLVSQPTRESFESFGENFVETIMAKIL